jgi:Xaa-Pro dipeptidase
MNEHRFQLVREFLARNGLGAWLAWRADELVMMTGHLPYWGVSVLLFPREGRPKLFVPALEPRDHPPYDVVVCEYPWGRLDCSDPFTPLKECIREELCRLGLAGAPLGYVRAVERSSPTILSGENPPFPPGLIDDLAGLAEGGWKDASGEFLRLYQHKTSEEVTALRTANRVANLGVAAFFSHLVAGRSEAEIAAAVESVIHASIGDDRVHFARGWALVQSGPNSADGGRFNRSTGRRLQEGDIVMMELATCVNGYWSDLSRTGAVGSLARPLQSVLNAVREAQSVAIAAVRPGVAGGEIDRVARDVVARHGFAQYFQHGTGHHVGFRYHDPGFGIAPGVKDVLEPGMVITIEPGIYGHDLGGGARIEDNILVTATGHEVLSHGRN